MLLEHIPPLLLCAPRSAAEGGVPPTRATPLLFAGARLLHRRSQALSLCMAAICAEDSSTDGIAVAAAAYARAPSLSPPPAVASFSLSCISSVTAISLIVAKGRSSPTATLGLQLRGQIPCRVPLLHLLQPKGSRCTPRAST